MVLSPVGRNTKHMPKPWNALELIGKHETLHGEIRGIMHTPVNGEHIQRLLYCITYDEEKIGRSDNTRSFLFWIEAGRVEMIAKCQEQKLNVDRQGEKKDVSFNVNAHWTEMED